MVLIFLNSNKPYFAKNFLLGKFFLNERVLEKTDCPIS